MTPRTLWKLESDANDRGSAASVLCFMSRRNRQYWGTTMYGRRFTATPCGSASPAELRYITTSDTAHGCSLVIAETDGKASTFDGVPAQFVIPQWIAPSVPLPWSPRGPHRAGALSDLRRGRRAGLRYEVTRDDERLRHFHQTMYLPYIARRHRQAAFRVPYELLLSGRPHLELLLVKQGDREIAGTVIVYDGPVPRLWLVGVRDGDEHHLQSGAIGATNYFAFEYLSAAGHTSVQLGLTRPFLSDGVTRFKLKWDPSLVDATSDAFNVAVLSPTPAVERLLAAHPFICRSGDAFKLVKFGEHASASAASATSERACRFVEAHARHGDKLAGLLETLEQDPSSHQNGAGEVSGVVRALEPVAAQSPAPRTDLLLTALVILIARRTDREDVVVAVTVDATAIDSQPDADAPTGPLPIRVSVPGNASLANVLGRVRRRYAAAWHTREAGIAHAQAMLDEGRCHIDYDRRLYATAEIRELSEQLRLILAQLASRPEMTVDAVSLVTDTARATLPDPQRPIEYSSGESVPTLVSRRARCAPSRVAVEDTTRIWTYEELDRWSDRLAHDLHVSGVGTEQVVGIYAERQAPLISVMLGVLKSGGAFLILDSGQPAERLRQYGRIARPAALINLLADRVADDQVIAMLGLEDVICRIGWRGSVTEREASAAPAPAPSTAGFDGRTPAYLAFTSGSTGQPKAVIGKHDSLTHAVGWYARTLGVHPDDRCSMLSSLAHDPLHRDVLLPLMIGATVCVPAAADTASPAAIMRWLTASRISVVNTTPSQISMLASCGQAAPDVRLVLSVGSVLTRVHVEHLRRCFPRATCVNLYGTTETQQALAAFVIGSSWPEDPGGPHAINVSIGTGIQDVQLLVMRSRTGEQAAVGEVGEIWVRSPYIAAGYLGNPELTAQRFRTHASGRCVDDRVYATGDRGQYDVEGRVTYLGRADRQIKIQSYRVELPEIEAALAEAPGVRDSAVVATPLDDGNHELCAFVVAEPDTGVTAEGLKQWLGERLPRYMVPVHIGMLERLPRTASGKPDLVTMRKDARVMTAVAPAAAPDGAGIELSVQRIFSEVLSAGVVGPDDDFFELGGDSMGAMEVAFKIRQEFGVDLGFDTVLVESNPRALAAAIQAA